MKTLSPVLVGLPVSLVGAVVVLVVVLGSTTPVVPLVLEVVPPLTSVVELEAWPVSVLLVGPQAAVR
jgi:hypothetical protein